MALLFAAPSISGSKINGDLHIVDYKTDEVVAAATPARAQEYAPQLALYAIALERAFGERPKIALLHFLRP